jgi:parallel beta-helix repeat protein
VPQNSGSAGSYITYSAYSVEKPVIDGNSITLSTEQQGLFNIINKSYIKISGLTIKKAGPNDENNGIFVDNSSYITIEKNYTYDTVSSGIGVWNSSNITIDGNEVEFACNDGQQECITVSGTDTFEVKNNHVHDSGPGTNGGEGIDAKDGSSNGKIYNNMVHDINGERTGIYIDSWDDHTFNIDVYQNISYDNSAGISLAAEAGGLLENISIYNNIVYNNRTNGLEIGNWGESGYAHPIKKIKFINNTVYNNGLTWGGGIFLENPTAQNIVIRNNIFSQNLSFQISNEAGITGTNLTVGHNLIDGYRDDDDEIRGTDYVEGDPLFVSASGADFQLQQASPAIDKGSSSDAPADDYAGNVRPYGAGYDIGAYEYGSGTGSTTTVSGSTTTALSTTTTTAAGLCPAEEIYGEDSEKTQLLRCFRDNGLSLTQEGRALIALYYQLSTVAVKMMDDDEEFKEEIKEMIDGVLELIE